MGLGLHAEFKVCILHAEWNRWEPLDSTNAHAVKGNPFPGEPGLRGLGRPKQLSPVQFFWKMFPSSLMRMMVEETNRYAEQQGAMEEGKRVWKDVDLGEMYKWHGLNLAMALHPLPSLEMYWETSSEGAVVFPGFSSCGMSMKRFEQIRRYFHICDGEKRQTLEKGTREHKLFHVAPVIEALNEAYKQHYVPGRRVTVDERTIPIRNRMCPIRMYNKQKPYKFGIEVFVICDSLTYFNMHFIVYDKIKCKELHTKMVVELVEQLPMKGYSVYLDRGFTSPWTLVKLRDMGHSATGTVMTNRKGFPTQELFMRKDEQVKGTVKAVVDVEWGICAVAWVDKKPVHFMSSEFGVDVKAVVRRTGSEREEVPCPELAREYNLYKDAVDQFDKLCLKDCYSVEQEVVNRKWWHRLYWGLFDGSLQNAWILYDLAWEHKPPLNHYRFLMSIQKALVFNGLERERSSRAVAVPQKKAVSRLDLSLGHFLVKGDKKNHCVVCTARRAGPSSDGRGAQTIMRCSVCTNVPLCIGQCFIDFHTLVDIPNLKIAPTSSLFAQH